MFFEYRIVRSLPASQGPLKGVIRDVPVLYDAGRTLSRRSGRSATTMRRPVAPAR
jgi:hypothetical protein